MMVCTPSDFVVAFAYGGVFGALVVGAAWIAIAVAVRRGKKPATKP